MTQSGLSMVDWDPIMGVVPPLNHKAWQASFDLYKQYPQYKKTNPQMKLSQYKRIFYWEYFHRMLGRLLGIVYLVGLLILSFKKKYSWGLKSTLWGGFTLICFQGLLGWYMVKSGLVDEPRVSPYRLVSHLGLAFFIFAYLFWIWMRQKWPEVLKKTKCRSLLLLTALCFLQILYGGFMAGLHAGKMYNTFPKMNGLWLPHFHFEAFPFWRNFFENPTLVQFLHRGLAWLLLSVFVLISLQISRKLKSFERKLFFVTKGLFVAQFVLGVITLLNFSPLSFSLVHQSMAFFLFTGLLVVCFRVRREDLQLS